MLSRGMFAALAFSIARRRRALPSGLPPPTRAATVTSRISFVHSWPRAASSAPFLRLIVAHLECPDILNLLEQRQLPAVAARERTPVHRRHAERVDRREVLAGTVPFVLREPVTW